MPKISDTLKLASTDRDIQNVEDPVLKAIQGLEATLNRAQAATLKLASPHKEIAARALAQELRLLVPVLRKHMQTWDTIHDTRK